MSGSLLAFAIAAVLEIAGCFAFWAWARRGASPLMVVLGIASLIGFALALTRVDAVFAGRAYPVVVDRAMNPPKGEYDVPNARGRKGPATTPAVR